MEQFSHSRTGTVEIGVIDATYPIHVKANEPLELLNTSTALIQRAFTSLHQLSRQKTIGKPRGNQTKDKPSLKPVRACGNPFQHTQMGTHCRRPVPRSCYPSLPTLGHKGHSEETHDDTSAQYRCRETGGERISTCRRWCRRLRGRRSGGQREHQRFVAITPRARPPQKQEHGVPSSARETMGPRRAAPASSPSRENPKNTASGDREACPTACRRRLAGAAGFFAREAPLASTRNNFKTAGSDVPTQRARRPCSLGTEVAAGGGTRRPSRVAFFLFARENAG